MKRIRYRKWNWEFDYGIGEICDDENPNAYTDAYFDNAGRLYRADSHKQDFHCSYEYFCDDRGRITEKRNYDDSGKLFVMVRISYDEATGMATETAWYPDDAEVQTVKIPISRYPWAKNA